MMLYINNSMNITIDQQTIIWLAAIMAHDIASDNNPDLLVRRAIYHMADSLGEIPPGIEWTNGLP
jgi:hypothetical protein